MQLAIVKIGYLITDADKDANADTNVNANAYMDYDTWGIASAFLCIRKGILKMCLNYIL